MHHFFDVEDAGDEYTFCPFPNSQPISTVGAPASITQTDTGACRIAFRIERVLKIPAQLSEDRQTRRGELVDLPITSDVYLYADQPGLYIKTRINNAAQDHKLTVNFPSGLKVAQAHVDAAFLIAERTLELPDSTGWVEDPTPLMHQRTFTDLSDGERGLAILNRGLPSVEVTEDGTIALTLLRSVGWLSRDDLWVRRIAAGPLVPTPGAQCLGTYEYDYAIFPHAGDWREVYQTAYNYNAPLLGRRADTHAGLELREMNITRDDPARVTLKQHAPGMLPDTHSFVAVDIPELVLSAVYTSGESLIVRVYNITREPVTRTIRFGFPVGRAFRVNMAEGIWKRSPLADNTCRNRRARRRGLHAQSDARRQLLYIVVLIDAVADEAVINRFYTRLVDQTLAPPRCSPQTRC